jgi:hypothetical protein
MAFLLAVMVLVGLLLPRENFKLSAPWGRRLGVTDATPSPAPQQQAGSDNMAEQWGMFSAAFVRERLQALEDELQRLDRNPDVFAKAFKTIAARSAYDALLQEVTTIAEQPWWRVGEVVDADVLGSPGGMREVLEF